MTSLAWLIPAALFLGALGLGAFLWALRSGQFEDLEGAAWRALEDKPASDTPAGAEDRDREPQPSPANDERADRG